MKEERHPLWAHDEPGHHFKVREAAKALAMPGLDVEAFERIIRRYESNNLILFRHKRGNSDNAHKLFAPCDLAVTAILANLTMDWGLAERGPLEAISADLYHWRKNDAVGDGHTISIAYQAYQRELAMELDRWWACRVDVLRDVETGKRRFLTHLFVLESGQVPPHSDDPRYIPRSTIMISLQPIFAAIYAAERRAKAN